MLFLAGGDSNSTRAGGGVIRTPEVSNSVPLAVSFLKGCSAACMPEPVLQAKLDTSLRADDAHLGHHAGLSKSLNEHLSSNCIWHFEQTNSYIGIFSSSSLYQSDKIPCAHE
jgi:hypothetical protein